MKNRHRMRILPLLAVLLLPFPAPAAEETGESVQRRMDRLQDEFDQLKQDYERDVGDLERRLEEKESRERRQGAPHRASPVGSYGGIMNPDISVIANIQALFTNEKRNDQRNKIRVQEVELAFQGYLFPGIRADVIPALEVAYEGDDVTVDVHLEEAYLTATQIPYVSEYVPLELQLGRKLMSFGRLNPVHPHHWPFADTPLVLRNFFGEHNWLDDGIQGSVTVPNPWDLYLKTTFGFWNGKQPGHAHEHEEDGEYAEEAFDEREPVHWNGRLFLSRSVFGFACGRTGDTLLGYSLAWDESKETFLHGGDLTFTYRFPGTYHTIRWQNEFFAADVRREDYRRYGGYTLLQVMLGKRWEVGYRYDRSQVLDPAETKDEWAASGFLTCYLTHSLYLRGQYRFRRMLDDEGEHNGYLQVVFGLGPHAHRLQD